MCELAGKDSLGSGVQYAWFGNGKHTPAKTMGSKENLGLHNISL